MSNMDVLSQELTARYAAWTGLMVVNGLVFSSAFGALAQIPSHYQACALLIATLGAIGIILPVIAFTSISSVFRAMRKPEYLANLSATSTDPDPLRSSTFRKWVIYICETGSALTVLASMLCLLNFVICG